LASEATQMRRTLATITTGRCKGSQTKKSTGGRIVPLCMKDWVVDPCPDRLSCFHADEEIGYICVDLDWGSDVSALLLAGRASHAQVRAIISEDK